MTLFHRLRLVALALLAMPAYAGAPNISVGALYEYIEPGKSSVLKRVRNSGDRTAFVRIDITELVYDEKGHASEKPIDTARIGAAATGHHALVASPARLIVPANGQQATRLLHQGDRDVEHVYRVRFIPVVPEKAGDFALNEDETKAYENSLQAGVNVLTGYGTVLIARPANTRYDTRLQDGGDSYTVQNNGNSTILIDDYVDCSAPKACTDHRKIHLRPGRSETFTKEAGHNYSFVLIEGEQAHKQSFSRP